MEENKIKNKQMLISVISIFILVLIVIGITYAAYSFTGTGTKENSITTGGVNFSYDEAVNGIELSNEVPTVDNVGRAKNDNVFNFTISANTTGPKGINYEITVVKDSSNMTVGKELEDESVRIYLEKSTDGGSTYTPVYEPTGFMPITEIDGYGAPSGEMILERANVIHNKDTEQVINYRLRLWVSENYDVGTDEKEFALKVNVHATNSNKSVQYQDPKNANAPELVGDMIPVIYDESGKSWVTVDTTTEWYNYSRQMWANAVTIKDTAKRATYKNAIPGTRVDITEVNTMWVWIPRYSYALQGQFGKSIGGSALSLETPGAFDIKFVSNTDVLDIGTGKYSDGEAIAYYTPSSFCWGDSCDTSRGATGNQELNGIWVSKFEMTGTLDNITSIPNEDSIRNQTTSAFHNAIKNNMNGNSGNTNYGFGTTGYNTHMIKNTEWGAFAYLTQSEYGKYGNSTYSGVNKEVYINNYYYNEQTKTGCSSGEPNLAVSNICNYEYNVIKGNGQANGVGASTTGTIYGIYDTNGGAWDKMMGYLDGSLGASEFTELPAERYWNKYTKSGETVTYIKGDATKETTGFYKDYAVNVNTAHSWCIRGGYWGDTYATGVFSFFINNGGIGSAYGSRMILIVI